jgi:hypothetical protein
MYTVSYLIRERIGDEAGELDETANAKLPSMEMPGRGLYFLARREFLRAVRFNTGLTVMWTPH